MHSGGKKVHRSGNIFSPSSPKKFAPRTYIPSHCTLHVGARGRVPTSGKKAKGWAKKKLCVENRPTRAQPRAKENIAPSTRLWLLASFSSWWPRVTWERKYSRASQFSPTVPISDEVHTKDFWQSLRDGNLLCERSFFFFLVERATTITWFKSAKKVRLNANATRKVLISGSLLGGLGFFLFFHAVGNFNFYEWIFHFSTLTFFWIVEIGF